MNTVDFFAGKPRSNWRRCSSVGAGLARDAGAAVGQMNPVDFFAGKPRSNWRRCSSVGAGLARDADAAVEQILPVDFIASKLSSHREFVVIRGSCPGVPDTTLSRIKHGTCRSELARDSICWSMNILPVLKLSRASSLLQKM
ncbi:hypothetical protein QCD79_30555, partial [Pseudomonas quasicaspiana]|nr:hypothetical protein [Pseudomonas quasicaspiana]